MYAHDRQFSDFVFNNLVKTTIFPTMGWTEYLVDKDVLNKMDLDDGIDALIQENNQNIFSIQYRFRDAFYQQYDDVTLRYKREFNRNSNRHNSEFFKIKANYLLYGVTNGKKFRDSLRTNTEFLKWAVIDVEKLMEKIRMEQIIIDDNLNSNCCKSSYHEGRLVMVCPVNYNTDNSSSFVPFSVKILNQIAPEVIVRQEGYL